MSPWESLVSAALLGTGRARVEPPAAGGALGELLARLDASDPEALLLSAAGAAALWRRAGRLPPRGGASPPAPCPPDELPRCGARAGQHLGLLLAGERRELLPEWLAAARSARVRAPEEHLPALLDACASDASLRALAEPVLGERGRWLAALNPRWSAAGAVDESLWQTGRRDERLALLARLREADPERGLDLVRASWDEETPADRAAILERLEVGLGAADEPFLEGALDDGRKEVRRVAAALLARLPSSALVARMAERMRPLLSHSRDAKGRGRLEVTLPAAVDRAAARDGVEAGRNAAGSGAAGLGAAGLRAAGLRGAGPRAAALRQMLSCVPPETWCREWGASAREIVAETDLGEWRNTLVDAWVVASLRFRDEEWAEAILRATLRTRGDGSLDAAVAALSAERRERLAADLLGAFRGPLRDNFPALAVLDQCRHVWSERLTAAFLDAYGRARGRAAPADYALDRAVSGHARRFAPSLAERVAAVFGEDSQAAAVARFRRDMLDALGGAARGGGGDPNSSSSEDR